MLSHKVLKSRQADFLHIYDEMNNDVDLHMHQTKVRHPHNLVDSNYNLKCEKNMHEEKTIYL